MSRNMAYVVTVNKIDPIPEKDKIVYIHFEENGYGVIADKSFTLGEKVIYFEVDSILPQKPQYEFLRKRCFNSRVEGFVIKNMKMCNLYSNGLILHLKEVGIENAKSGEDFTNKLGIGKLEDFADASPKQQKQSSLCKIMMSFAPTRWLAKLIWFKKRAGAFPEQYIQKSDETNIQNEKKMFNEWKKIPCYISRKHEGQSVTMIMLPKKKSFTMEIYGRNALGTQTHIDWAEKNKVLDKFKKIFKVTKHLYAVQGEFCGPGIQKNVFGFPRHRFFVYKVVDITDKKTLSYGDMVYFCTFYGFDTVKMVEAGIKLEDKFNSVEELQEYVEHMWFNNMNVQETDTTKWQDYDDRNEYPQSGKIERPAFTRWEGVVIRGMNNEFSFKVKSNEYALWFGK